MLQAGERAWHLKRLISMERGTGAADDHLPPKRLAPLAAGPHAGSVPDMPLMLAE